MTLFEKAAILYQGVEGRRILVLGDAIADWLAAGLEDAYAELRWA